MCRVFFEFLGPLERHQGDAGVEERNGHIPSTSLKIKFMNIKKTTAGNYFGYHKGHYLFIYKRPHGKWCCRIGRGGHWLFSEGYHGTFLRTLSKAKKWAIDKLR